MELFELVESPKRFVRDAVIVKGRWFIAVQGGRVKGFICLVHNTSGRSMSFLSRIHAYLDGSMEYGFGHVLMGYPSKSLFEEIETELMKMRIS